MSHQSEIEKKKYRNWVKGGLAYKYLKQGLDDFADDVVKQEQSRILSSINCSPGTICNQCIIERLRPIHACITKSGNYECPWGQRKCNCLHLKKKKCRLKVCDFIMEEILKSHGSTPPTPNWANTNIQKWCTEPWEVAKCFINAPGYSDKEKAADIDISGLLHVFINNTSLHSHLACSMAGTNIFIKVRERRNKLFHSATMETEEGEVAECIDDIVEILEDPKELRGRPEAVETVNKLEQLKESKFVITTNDEADVCKEAIMCVTQKAEELKQVIEEVKSFNERVQNFETSMSEKVEELTTDHCKRIGKLESDVSSLKSDFSAVKERMTLLESKVRELDSKRDIYKRHLDYLKGKQELQAQLVKYYKKHYVKTSLSPLKQQQDTINIKDVYVTPEIEVMEEEKCVNIDKNTTEKPGKRYIQRYHDIFKTKGQRYKKIYILGDVGTGKSTFCKMMIENWCNAVSGRTNESSRNENYIARSETHSSDINLANEFDDVYQMGQYEFLFFIQLQYMSVLKTDVTVDMIKELTRDLTSNNDLVDRIFQEDSMHCLIIIDSLDEWTPPKDVVRKPHVSYGIPNGDRAKDATVLTLSRPSAKGILNLKNSEIDLKSHLLGISSSSLKSFIEQYISQTASTQKSYNEFITIMKTKQIGHIEKTPLLLQQILWLYCYSNDIVKELGKSVSETYCQILNIMCGWSNHKADGNDERNDAIGDTNILLPENLQRYPRFRHNKRVLFLMGAAAFDVLTSGSIRNIFGRQHLLEKGLSVDDVTKLLELGILNESNCFDPTQEDTQLSFIHMSYLEFFAALYVTLNENIKETKCLREKEYEKQEALENLFGTCESASDILQLSNVIKMVCGLSPTLIGDLSQRISCIVNKDKHIVLLRRHGYKILYRNDEIIQIQRLMVECLKECGSCENTMISISDLCINDIEPRLPLQRINTNDVISLSFEETSDENIIDYIRQCKYLQHICIKDVSFKNMEEFSFLSQQLSVKQITLHLVDVLDTHSLQNAIDLSKQEHLQILELFSCDNITISDLPSQQLEFVHIQDCSGILNFEHLQKANKLTELYIENYNVDLVSQHERHKIDLSTNNHLKTLKLIKCHDILVTGFSTEQLEHMYIKDLPCTLDFELLSNASRLTELHIENCAVDLQSQHARHDIDLSRQNLLQTVILLDCPDIEITGINTEKLEQACIRECKDALGVREKLSYSMIRMELRAKGITGINTEKLKQACIRENKDTLGDVSLLLYSLKEMELKDITDLDSVQLEHAYNNIHKDTNLLLYSREDMVLHVKGLTVNKAVLKPLLHQTSLRQVELYNVKCNKNEFLNIDLSRQNYLQTVILLDCPDIEITDINTEQLDLAYIRRNKDIDMFTYLKKDMELYLKGITVNIAMLKPLLKQTSLRHVTLDNVKCYQNKILHIDLSGQNHLQNVTLIESPHIVITGLNTEQLVHLQIDNDKHYYYYSSYSKPTLQFDFPSNFRKHIELKLVGLTVNLKTMVLLLQHRTLRQLTLNNVSGDQHVIQIDLSKQSHLQILKLSKCKNIKISDINTEALEYVQVIDCVCIFDSEFLSNTSKLCEIHLECLSDNMTSLVSFVEHASLRHLTLIGVNHCQSEDVPQIHKKHVDLSKQNNLQFLKLSNCSNIQISNLNTEQLEQVHIKCSPDIFRLELLVNARKLTELIVICHLSDKIKFRKREGYVVETLHNLEKLHLKHVDIDDNALTVIPEMRSLKTIKLEYTSISINTWRTFLDSLLTLHQSVEVDIYTMSNAHAYRYNVEINPKFKVISKHDDWGFCVQTNI